MASTAAVAERGNLIDKVIMPDVNEAETARELGLYRFRFFDLDWFDVFIDDVIAKDYVAKPSKGEYWVPLIQKAYAKFYGNYDKLTGGSALTGLYNLTGGLMLSLKPDQNGVPNSYWSDGATGAKGFDLFEFMMKHQDDAIYCSGNGTTASENVATDITGKTEKVDKHGLVAPHAYSIIQLVKVHKK